MDGNIKQLEEAGSVLAEHVFELQSSAPNKALAEYRLLMLDEESNKVEIYVRWKEEK